MRETFWQAEQIIEEVTYGLKEILKDNLVGIYLHGSMVLGGFSWDISDLDLLVVVRNPLTCKKRGLLFDFLMDKEPSFPKKGIELSVVLLNVSRSVPASVPYEFHFSKDWRKKREEAIQKPLRPDEDLAAHFMVMRNGGRVIWGEPVDAVFGPVSKEQYMKSVWADIEIAKTQILQEPVYVILNLCRTWVYLMTGEILSKREGGRRALEEGSLDKKMISWALHPTNPKPSAESRKGFATHMLEEIQGLWQKDKE